MALSTDGKLVYLLEVDDKGSPVIKKFSGNIEKVGKSSQQAASRAKKLNSSLLGMKSAMAGLGVGLLAKQILDAGRAFESSVSDLSAITGATGKNLEFMKNKALEFSKQTTQSAQASVEAFKLVASAKPDLLDNADALARVTREAIRLSEASGVTLSDSAKTVGASLNQFGAEADKAASFVNVLAAGAKFGSSEISDTAQALKIAGTVAHDTGLSFEETNAAIQAMAAVALKGSEAGTGLRGVLLKLENQANDQFKPSIVGMAGAFKNLGDANLTTTEKTKLFGLESITAANALIKQADNLEILTGKLTGTATATEQARIKTNNLNGDIKHLDNAMMALGISSEGTANVGLRALVQGFTEIISSGSDAAKQSEDVSLAIAGIADFAGNAARGAAAPFQILIDMLTSTGAAISLIAEGDIQAAFNAIDAGAKDVGDVFGKMVDPHVSSRFTDLAQKMIADMHKTQNASKNLKDTAEKTITPNINTAPAKLAIREIVTEVNGLRRVLVEVSNAVPVQTPQQVQGSRATGGMIPHDGFYMMHAGERVTSNSQSFGDINISVPGGQGSGNINWRDVVRNQIMPEIALAAQR